MTHSAPRTSHSEESWQSQILREFPPGIARLTLVADPDGLLTEENIAAGLRERGFDLITFDDPMAFRYVYESKYRSRWDRGESAALVVALRASEQAWHEIPYDVLQVGRKLTFSLSELFPKLSYPVVAELDRGDLDALYRAQRQHNSGKLGLNASKDFILQHVFGMAPQSMLQPSDLLRCLLRRHYQGRRLPPLLDERFIDIVRRNRVFADWPLESIVPDRQAFFAFLQERWPIFLDRLVAGRIQGSHEAPEIYTLAYPGPAVLPFDHDDVRIYVDNLFLDGLLQPVPYREIDVLEHPWVTIGIQGDRQADQSRRLERLITAVASSIPTGDVRHPVWLTFAQRWAELIALYHGAMGAVRGAVDARTSWAAVSHDAPRTTHLYLQLREQVDAAFLAWVQKRYGSLHNLPSSPPVMLHHVPRYLASMLELGAGKKVALLLLDGLALDQWVVLRKVLQQQQPQVRFQEEAVFAWIPTITSVSRQAAFAGKPPIYYPSSIHTTDKEAMLWTQFWIGKGFAQAEVAYAKGLGEKVGLATVEEILSQPKVRILGLVIDTVDKIMHGMQLGTAGMHNQVRQWAAEGFMAALLDQLFEHRFAVFLTSDHGNIEAIGMGRPAEGVVADTRGERVRVYPDGILRAGVKARFPDAIEWPPVGLPEDYLPLIAPDRSAFIREGERIVAHGGISIEEVIVPLIRIERRAL
ncbi:MAG TPA: BREX-3 system phosphatase PglZ [Alphaproteobacteria bacterium]|nr:BREX-3 system phosphatase PglZ [Alphaproteobacteria bacterium]